MALSEGRILLASPAGHIELIEEDLTARDAEALAGGASIGADARQDCPGADRRGSRSPRARG